jgi:hypothetical protein
MRPTESGHQVYHAHWVGSSHGVYSKFSCNCNLSAGSHLLSLTQNPHWGSCKYKTIYPTMGYSVKLTSIQSPSTTQVDRKKGNNSHRSPLATVSQSSCVKKPYPLMKHLRKDWIWDHIAGENIGCHTRCTFLSADCCNGWVTVICWSRQGLWDC